jgi:hypothetical protein
MGRSSQRFSARINMYALLGAFFGQAAVCILFLSGFVDCLPVSSPRGKDAEQ